MLNDRITSGDVFAKLETHGASDILSGVKSSGYPLETGSANGNTARVLIKDDVVLPIGSLSIDKRGFVFDLTGSTPEKLNESARDTLNGMDNPTVQIRSLEKSYRAGGNSYPVALQFTVDNTAVTCYGSINLINASKALSGKTGRAAKDTALIDMVNS